MEESMHCEEHEGVRNSKPCSMSNCTTISANNGRCSEHGGGTVYCEVKSCKKAMAPLGWNMNVVEWDRKLDTYRFEEHKANENQFGTEDGFFQIPKIEQRVEDLVHQDKCLIYKKLERARKPMDKEKGQIDVERKQVNENSEVLQVEATKIKEWSAEAKKALEELEARRQEEAEIAKRQEAAREADHFFHQLQMYSPYKMLPVVHAAVVQAAKSKWGGNKSNDRWAMVSQVPVDMLTDMATNEFWLDVDHVADFRTEFNVIKEEAQPGAIKGACGDCGMPVRNTHERYKDEGSEVYYHDNTDDCYRARAGPVWNISTGSQINTSYWSDNKMYDQHFDGIDPEDLLLFEESKNRE